MARPTVTFDSPEPAPRPLPQLAHGRASLLHSGTGVELFHAQHAVAAMFPMVAGVILFGWRALLVAALVLASNLLGTLCWRHIGRRGAQIYIGHSLWLAMLLTLMIPAHLADRADALWAIPVAAGLLLAMLTWALGGLGSGRIHPALVAYLLLFVLFERQLTPQLVLERSHVLVGDVLKAPAEPRVALAPRPWITTPGQEDFEALRIDPAPQRLWEFTTGATSTWLSLAALVRDRLPPLEDLILGGHPRSIGLGSGIAVIVGGLFLLYRGLIDYRIPVLIIGTTYAMLLILPIPIVITDTEPRWQWFIWRSPEVGWGLAITFANYQILASPLLMMAFFLATAPSLRPMHRRARTVYAILVGIASAFAMLYTSVLYGPYLALLLVSLLSPALEYFTRPRPLV